MLWCPRSAVVRKTRRSRFRREASSFLETEATLLTRVVITSSARQLENRNEEEARWTFAFNACEFLLTAGSYRGSTKMDIDRSARGRYRTTGLHVQDPRRYNDRRCRRSQATQPRGTGSSNRSQVSRKFMPPYR